MPAKLPVLSGRNCCRVLGIAMDEELAWVEFDDAAHGEVTIDTIAAWDYLNEKLSKDGVQPPERWSTATSGGFCQALPADEPLALAWERRGKHLVIATALGDGAANHAKSLAAHGEIEAAALRAHAWWTQYWDDVPRVTLPDSTLQHAYDYGVFRQAGLTTPGAVAATLVGPWMVESALPGWSNDYHFNINVQLIYWPSYGTNRLQHLEPLWKMVNAWVSTLRKNAEQFFGTPDALMLPHAVDDRCEVVGNFWTGSIDQACAAWVAQMAWLHYRYSMDLSVLRDLAWPMLNGAFNGYWAMTDEISTDDGARRLSLPVSVSPEYNGSGMDAWGRDASFQLAAYHFLANALTAAAKILGEPEDPRWVQVQHELPPYTLFAGQGRSGQHEQRIALWDGQDLAISHRHQSHLGAIYPFCTIDPMAPEHRQIVKQTLEHWLLMGSGEWTGWAMPWVSTLCSRCGMTDAAVAWLRWGIDLYTTEGHAGLHNANFAGATRFDDGSMLGTPPDRRRNDCMQMDAAMGAITAILEMLVQCRGDEIVVLPKIPYHWRSISFDGIRTEGAFLIGATVERGKTVEVRVTSLAGAPLQLTHGLGDSWTLNGEPHTGEQLVISTCANEQFVLSRR